MPPWDPLDNYCFINSKFEGLGQAKTALNLGSLNVLSHPATQPQDSLFVNDSSAQT